MNATTSLNKILPVACPSIQYRIQKELLNTSPSVPEMINLQDQILQDHAVKKVVDSQSSDGWLGSSFHGYDSLESGIRILSEKGVEADHPVLVRALQALEKHVDHIERGFGKVGRRLDELGLGGAETIRAYLFALAGQEKISCVQKQITQTLEVFRSVRQVKSLENLYEGYKGKLIFREEICWPSIYHLRLLALTQNWRTPENSKIVLQGIQQIVRLSPIPNIYVKHRSQLIAPASFCMHDFKPDLNMLTDDQWMEWFHRMELLARLGVVRQIPELQKQIQILENILVRNQGLFTKKLSHPYFQKWGAYTGLALEKDWRLPQRRINDLTFRSLLILHYSCRSTQTA